ncbi:hypothetical protein B0H19DRAFT_1142246, partial [Mycena capillaripes]
MSSASGALCPRGRNDPALVSLARRLPEGVIREIFLACLTHSGSPVISAREAPLLLDQTPQVWSSVYVVAPNSARLQQINVAGKTLLTQSSVLPLSITLAVSAACESGSDNVATMIDVLVNFSSRWKHVKITLSPRTILTPLTNLNASDVPILESIAFTSLGRGSWQNLVTPLESPWRAFNFFRTPSIRSASFASLDGNFLALPHPWPLLQSFTFTAGNLKDASSFHLTTTFVLIILRQCPNLTRYTICLTSERTTVFDDPGPRPSPILLAHLTESHLTLDIKDLAGEAFTHCTELLPALIRLRLVNDGDYDPWSTPHQREYAYSPATGSDLLRVLTPDLRVSKECLCLFLRRLEVVEHPLSHVEVVFTRQREFDMIPYLAELVATGCIS